MSQAPGLRTSDTYHREDRSRAQRRSEVGRSILSGSRRPRLEMSALSHKTSPRTADPKERLMPTESAASTLGPATRIVYDVLRSLQPGSSSAHFLADIVSRWPECDRGCHERRPETMSPIRKSLV